MHKLNRYINHKIFYLLFYLVNFFINKKKLVQYGSGHGKYKLPQIENNTNNQKWILSAGVGDNITFDLEFLKKNYNVVFIDPTPKSIEYFNNEIKKYNFKGKFEFFPQGLWEKKEKLKFFFSDKKVISNTISNYNKSNHYVTISTCTIDDVKSKIGIKDFYIIKLDIEGSEYEVINYMKKKGIKSTFLLIEFDFLKHHNIFLSLQKLFLSLKRIRSLGYVLLNIDNLNFTFECKD